MNTQRAFAPWTQKERDRIRMIRLDEGWSYAKLAELVGVPESTARSVLETDRAVIQTTAHKFRRFLEKYVPTASASAAGR